MAKSFKDYWVNEYTNNAWVTVYTFSTTDSSSNMCVLLAFLMKNSNDAGAGAAVNIEARIVNNAGTTVIYPITKCTLSAQDEFHLDRAKQFFVLEPSWKIQVKFSGTGMYTYLSVLENI